MCELRRKWRISGLVRNLARLMQCLLNPQAVSSERRGRTPLVSRGPASPLPHKQINVPKLSDYWVL